MTGADDEIGGTAPLRVESDEQFQVLFRIDFDGIPEDATAGLPKWRLARVEAARREAAKGDVPALLKRVEELELLMICYDDAVNGAASAERVRLNNAICAAFVKRAGAERSEEG